MTETEQLKDQLDFLKGRVRQLKKRAKYWKDNHDQQVKLKRKLRVMYDTLLRETKKSEDNV